MTDTTIRVLVVDDDPTGAVLTTLALAQVSRPRFDVHTVDELTEAIKELEANDFDILLLDLGLGKYQGLEALRTVRASDKKIPIVVLAGPDNTQASLDSLDAGAQDCLSKDVISPSSLSRAIRNAIQRQQLLDTLAEASKRAEQKKFVRFLECAPDAIVIIDQNDKIILVNYQTEQLFGYQRDELLGQPIDLLVAGSTHVVDLEQDLPHASREQICRCKDGSTLPVEIRVATIDTDEGICVCATIRDITWRKEAEAEITQLARFTSENPDTVLRVSSAHQILYANPASAVLLNFWGVRVGDQLPDDLRPFNREAIDNAGKVSIEVVLGEREYEIVFTAIPESDYVNLYGREITERRRAEEALKSKEAQFYQAQKLESLGQLAGGVAHEFNNLLQAIQGYTKFAIKGLAEDDQRCEDLHQVLKASERAATLTRQLLGFSRREVVQAANLDPTELVRELLKLLRPLIGEDIELNAKLSHNVGLVYGDPTLLQQMLMNLCVNARDAMPEGGSLVIACEAVTLNEAYADANLAIAPGRYVLFSVSDTGCGMTSHVREQIFEPFFTTKEIGKGTGLGLAMVYGVVRQHQGGIHVYSELGLGTTFKVYLPVSNSSVEAMVADRDDDTAPGGHETILLAEDEPLVRHVAVRILSEAGYRVLAACDGEEAVRLFSENADDITLAILDVVMPKLNGRMVYQAIKCLKPDVNVIFCSGYDAETNCGDFAANEELQLIRKPFDPSALLRMVRTACDANPGQRMELATI
jgi:PAS domain S-box-containing protein